MIPPDFTLHTQLAADTVPVCMLGLCHVRLMKDANYPWLILVPARPGIRELHDLDEPDRQSLMREITMVSRTLRDLVGAHKMNVAALGNMVPQLHVHVIARFEADAAWPRPVWGAVPAKPHDTGAQANLVAALRQAFGISG